MLQAFTAFEYLLIDIANQWGLDKENYNVRLDWTKKNFNQLEDRAVNRGHWKEYPLYMKAVMALRKAQKGESTGHMMGFDATTSGMQIMSAMTGCVKGALITNLLDPDNRYNAYEEVYKKMREYLPALSSKVNLEDIKQAVMTTLYGSTAEPEKMFGKGTEELAVFYKALNDVAPAACELLQLLLKSWNSTADKHSFILPDNHHVHIKVRQVVESKLEIDELDHSRLTYTYSIDHNNGFGLANAANVIHAIDGYIVRTISRWSSLNKKELHKLNNLIQGELLTRHIDNTFSSDKVTIAKSMFKNTNMPDISLVFKMSQEDVASLTTKHLIKVQKLLFLLLKYPAFDVVTVHDCFACSPVYVQALREYYNEIMALLAESTLMDYILSTLYGFKITYKKKSITLPSKIRKANYAIC